VQQTQHVHFIGIGGSGMCGIARIMLGLGYRVTGSDLKTSTATENLEALGATCFRGHAGEYLGDADIVVASTAIPFNNPELVEARQRGIRIMHRSEVLAWLMGRQKGIAIAGAHGKTTTTAMSALVLENNHMDPTIIIGGEMKEIGGNAKLGRGEYLIAEADESDGSFLKLEPFIEIITNIEDDHLDHYKSMENIEAAFNEFIAKVPAAGMAVVCIDDPKIEAMLASYQGPYLTYGLEHPDADYTGLNLRMENNKQVGDVHYRGSYLGQLTLGVPGRHNFLNALAVVALGRFIGLSFDGISAALSSFKGVGRRFQLTGEVNGIKVFDDYAHHPSEIKATLSAARQLNPGRLISVFQPHRYSRTAMLADRFGEAFSEADIIIISDIYSAGEKPLPDVSAALISSAIEKFEGRKPIYLPSKQDIVDYLLPLMQSGDMVLTMGAGDIWETGVALVNNLKERQ
jgi:UDP-N-acetylmuramate--alanine ligase